MTTAMSVVQHLNTVQYGNDGEYVPSPFALQFVNFIKLIEGGDPENKTPVVHYKMLDQYDTDNGLDTINMCHRGVAKTTLKEYIILYLAVFGGLPTFGDVAYALYVSDSIDNGVKKMRKSLELRWENSPFLKTYISKLKFTDIRWEFVRQDGSIFITTAHGAKSGVRGTRENNSRPVLALLDDLISDADAKSPTVIASVEDTVYNAIDYALHPKKRKVIWSGTPFNARDPLYKAVESGAWNVNVYPVCEQFPCEREDFKGSWEDRFDFDYVTRMYTKAKLSGKLDSFNQELMLRIISSEDRLVKDQDIQWYDGASVRKNRDGFNIYITTDFATSEKKSADFSTIFVWGYNSNGDWYWIDGVVAKQSMDKNIDDLFRLSQRYKPLSVGIEVTGQQGGFIPWIQSEMLRRRIWFTLASDKGGNVGMRPTTDKMTRFLVVHPLFKMGKMYFPEDMRDTPEMVELMDELTLITAKAFQSKHDDCIDPISMLALMNPWAPSAELEAVKIDNVWRYDDDIPQESQTNSYTV